MKKEYVIIASAHIRRLDSSATVLLCLGIILFFSGVVLFPLATLAGKDYSQIFTIAMISAALSAIIKTYATMKYCAERKQVNDEIERVLKREDMLSDADQTQI